MKNRIYAAPTVKGLKQCSQPVYYEEHEQTEYQKPTKDAAFYLMGEVLFSLQD